MWHILEKYNRVVAKKVSNKEADYLLAKQGGLCSKNHIAPQGSDVMGYIINENPIYNYGKYLVIADEKEIACVTRKKDAFRIMQALKRDYKEIHIKIKK